MNMATKRSIFREHLEEWLAAAGDKKQRGELVRMISRAAKVHPKSVPRSFRRVQFHHPLAKERRGRSLYFTPDVTAALKDVWEALGEPCGENLHPQIPECVELLRRDRLWAHGDLATGKLLAASQGTVKDRVRRFERSGSALRGRGTTKPGTIHALIPLRSDGWSEAPVGTCQIDTVAHCGHSIAGDYAHTVNATDVATLWGERRAQWQKGQEATVRSLERIQASFPTDVVEYHPDSGSEFVNWHCHGWCEEQGIRLTRSRPNRKNDNCFVEERNGHIVRRFVKYGRFDAPEAVEALNAVYDVLTPYCNHFRAVRRILSKEKVGARWKITREKQALTPYARMLARSDVSEEVKAKLREEHAKLNPLLMKREIDRRLKILFDIQRRHGRNSEEIG